MHVPTAIDEQGIDALERVIRDGPDVRVDGPRAAAFRVAAFPGNHAR